jgi:hypothetical protein
MLPDQKIGSLSLERGYDKSKCHDAILTRHTHAVILRRKNAKLWKPGRKAVRARRGGPQSICGETRADITAKAASK